MTMTNVIPRPVFVVRLQSAPGVDGIRALRALLKTAWRRFRLRALDVREEAEPKDATQPRGGGRVHEEEIPFAPEWR
jgi:hypothetical protein